MPKIPKLYYEQQKKRATRNDWKIRWYCPKCGAVHHYPFTDGCHRNGCGYKGELKQG